jgi:hypothetical protein
MCNSICTAAKNCHFLNRKKGVCEPKFIPSYLVFIYYYLDHNLTTLYLLSRFFTTFAICQILYSRLIFKESFNKKNYDMFFQYFQKMYTKFSFIIFYNLLHLRYAMKVCLVKIYIFWVRFCMRKILKV